MNDVTDAVVDQIEDELEGVVDVLEVVQTNTKAVVAAAIIGVALGSVAGYFVAKKRLTTWYEDMTTQEIAEAKQFYANLNKVDVDGTPLSPQDVMEQRHGSEAAVAALQYYQGKTLSSPDEEPELGGEPHDDIMDEEVLARTEAKLPQRRAERQAELAELQKESDEINVFVDTTFDLEEESKYRTPDKPYIITHEEFFEAEKEYDTQNLTYFEVDDTLVDEHDKPIEEVDAVIGEDHLVRFGSGSRDKKIVYVRNDRLETDYEIIKSNGSYLEDVLGMPDEEPNSLKHSNRNAQLSRRRAFRHGEE